MRISQTLNLTALQNAIVLLEKLHKRMYDANFMAQQDSVVRLGLQMYVPHCEVLAFGSRYRHTAWKHSNLNLAVAAESRLPLATLANMQIVFKKSDLPFHVDVLDWHALSPEFQQVITQGY